MALGLVMRKWLLVLVAAGAAGAVVMYLLASWVPGDYRPVRLNHQAREQATSRFYSRVFKFMSDGEDVKPFTWSASEEWLNRYLSSMDEIAFRKGGERGQADRMMAKAGLTEPMVALDDGAITLLARSTKYDKIISAKLAFEFTPDGKLRIRLAGARMGRAPVPAWVVRGRIEKLKRTVGQRLLAMSADREPSSAGVAKVLGRVIAAIDGEPIDTELTWRLHSKKRVRISRIDISDGMLTLHVVPVGRASPGERGPATRPGGGRLSPLPAGA